MVVQADTYDTMVEQAKRYLDLTVSACECLVRTCCLFFLASRVIFYVLTYRLRRVGLKKGQCSAFVSGHAPERAGMSARPTE